MKDVHPTELVLMSYLVNHSVSPLLLLSRWAPRGEDVTMRGICCPLSRDWTCLQAEDVVSNGERSQRNVASVWMFWSCSSPELWTLGCWKTIQSGPYIITPPSWLHKSQNAPGHGRRRPNLLMESSRNALEDNHAEETTGGRRTEQAGRALRNISVQAGSVLSPWR